MWEAAQGVQRGAGPRGGLLFPLGSVQGCSQRGGREGLRGALLLKIKGA